MTNSRVAERYGRTRAHGRRRLALGITAALAMVAVVSAWVVWVGLFTPGASIQAQDVGYVTREDSTIDVRFTVTVNPGTPASCALQALNEDFAIVGWKIVELAPSESLTREFVENVRITEPAVTGLIYRCWLS